MTNGKNGELDDVDAPKGYDSEFFHEDVRKVYEMQQHVIDTLQEQKQLTESHYGEIRKITADLKEIMQSNAEKTEEILKIQNFIVKDVGPAFGKLLEKINEVTESEEKMLQEIKNYQQDEQGNALKDIIVAANAIQQMVGSVMRTCHSIKGDIANVDEKVETVKLRTAPSPRG
ncbi:MAG: hypothetical protein PHT07_09975 [Paludibacter sp.]|nr:hypothetical protein [Paludibacter sp.]